MPIKEHPAPVQCSSAFFSEFEVAVMCLKLGSMPSYYRIGEVLHFGIMDIFTPCKVFEFNVCYN